MSATREVPCVALGEDFDGADVVEVVKEGPLSSEDRLAALEKQMFHITNAHDSLFSMVKEMSDKLNMEAQKAIEATIEKKKANLEIPEGTVLYGTSKGQSERQLSYFLSVKNGAFYVGVTRYDSLSAAAEGVSGVRRSGWTFWKLPDGKSVKEAFKS